MENKSLEQNKLPASRPTALARASSALSGMIPGQPKAPAFGLREILTIGFKYKVKIIIIFLLAVLVSPIVYYLIPRIYQAHAQIMVKFGWEYMYGPELALQGKSSVSPYARNEVVNSEIQILNSRDLKERVLTTVGVAKMYPDIAKASKKKENGPSPLELALIQFEKDFSVNPISGSSVVELSLKGENPQVLAEALNQLIFFYGVKRLEIFKDPKSILFLEKKVAEYRQNLQGTEDELESFKQQTKVYSLDEQRSLLLNQQMSIDSSLMDAQNQTKELQRKLASFEKQIKTIAKEVPRAESQNGATTGPQAQLLNLQLKEQELLGKYKEDNRLVVEVRKQIELLKEHIKNTAASGSGTAAQANEVYQEAQKEIIKTKAELSALDLSTALLKQQLDDINKEIQSLDLHEKKMRELRRDLATDETNYQNALSKLEESRVYDEMDTQKITSVSVIQPAKVPIKPITPSKGLPYFLGIGAFLGLGSGFGLAYGLEMIAQRFTTPEEAQRKLRLPILATVPLKKV